MKFSKESIPEAAVTAFESAYEKEWDRVADSDEGRTSAWNGGADRAATIAGIEAALEVVLGEPVAWAKGDGRGRITWGKGYHFAAMQSSFADTPLYTLNNGEKRA